MAVIFVFGVGFISIFLVRFIIINYFTSKQEIKNNIQHLIKPPEKAFTGSTVELSGFVIKKTRQGSEEHIASISSNIIQGESIVTDSSSSATVQIDDILNLKIEKDSVIGFSNLLPETILLSQPEGNVTYEVSNNKNISVRSTITLIQISDGIVNIKIDKRLDEIQVSVKTGKVKLAYEDNDNQTKVYEALAGNFISVNRSSKKVIVD